MDTPLGMPWIEAFGWGAATLTLLTFFCRDMRRLRVLAIAANAAFIAYGALAQLVPVLVLHLALVPVNLWRLRQAFGLAAQRTLLTNTVGGRTDGVPPGDRNGAERGWTATRRNRRCAHLSLRNHNAARSLGLKPVPRADRGPESTRYDGNG